MSATLSGLTIGSLTLTPAFEPDVREYSAETTNARNTITATPMDAAATVTITVGNEPVENGGQHTWAEGDNVVIIHVRNGDLSTTYTVTVTKS